MSENSSTEPRASRAAPLASPAGERHSARTPASNPKAAVLLRALKRKLSTTQRHQQKLIDETLEQLVA